jgi:signal transduction histidine kinase
MPLDLSARGLGEALRGLTRSLEEVYGLAVTVEVAEGAVDLGDETAFHLYRIAQEALNNAARHADAAHVHVAVRPAPEGLALVVRDDGRGIAPEVLEARPGLGLRTMRHRAEQIGARLTVRPLEAGGTEVRCVVPYVTSDT